MKILLIIGLLFSLLIYAYRIFLWSIVAYKFCKGNKEIIEKIKQVSPNMTALFYTLGGIEHLVIFASLLASLIIIW